MTIELKDCPICDASDWHSLDYLRDQKYWYLQEIREYQEPIGFKICKSCGFVTYDYIDPERLQAIYDFQRPVMSINNIVTSNRKNQYHSAFFKGVDIEGPVLDVGCAQGAFLHLMEKQYGIDPKDLYGTEYSAAFANWAKYFYGYKVGPGVEDGKTFGLISYYHVLEHVQNPGEELERIKKFADNKTLFYISVPVWFDILEESSGVILNDFENYYHLNHVNVFSEKSFINLLRKHGLRVIKTDKDMYGYTVLCVLDDTDKTVEKENWELIVQDIEKQKAAIRYLQPDVNKPAEAVKIYPKFTDAYIFWALDKNNMKKFEPQKEILENALKLMPNNFKLKSQLARLYFQWDENTPEKKGLYSNNVKMAERLFQELIEEKPGNEESWFMLAMIEHKYKKNSAQAIKCLEQVMKMNPMRHAECVNNIAVICKEYV